MPDMDLTTTLAASATVAGSVAAVYAGLTFHRNSAKESEVKWAVEVVDGAVTLTCHGPGDAADVVVMLSESAMPLSFGTYKRASMPAGSRARLGTIAPASGYLPIGKVRVEYTRRGRFGRGQRVAWESELA